MSEIKESLRQRIFYAARDGMAITLFALVSDQPKEEIPEYFNHLIEEDGQKCTPLIIASKNGHDNVVKMILSKFISDVNQVGTVLLDGYVIEGVTPLWCAAGTGHLNVVRTLVSHGADVNHPTKTNSTPLRAACFDGRLDIVRFLVENHADIHIANRYNNTCLMIASYKGHLEVVKYLLAKGSDPNTRALCGSTALHFAAGHGHLGTVKELLKHDAVIMKNANGMTPSLSAAERTKDHIVEFFVQQDWCSKEDKIEALELLGASYANDKDNYSLDKAFYYLNLAMKERYSDGSQIILKPNYIPVAAYESRRECSTVEDLQAMRQSPDALHMEALAIRERILGPNNPEVPQPIIFRGAVFADSARFDRCLQLWLHALHLRNKNNISIRKDLLRFAQLFSQMLHIGVDVSLEYVEEVLSTAAKELERNLSNMSEAANYDAYHEELDDNMHTVLYLLVIVSRLLKKMCVPEQQQRILRLVYRLNQLNLATKDGSTLLHLTVNVNTPVDDFHTKNICKFPCSATAKLLIQCGANVNAVNNDRNTALHLIVAYQKPISDFLTLHNIITALIEAGAHIDSVNNNGETPLDAATTGVAEIILRTEASLSLKCMAAKAVKQHNIMYEGTVPRTLESFIEMHGVPCNPQLRVG